MKYVLKNVVTILLMAVLVTAELLLFPLLCVGAVVAFITGNNDNGITRVTLKAYKALLGTMINHVTKDGGSVDDDIKDVYNNL